MTDTVVTQIALVATSLFATFGSCFAVYIGYLTLKLRSFNDKLDGLAKVAKASHTLLNSEHGVLLKEVAAMKRKEASRTGLATDVQAADKAEADYAAHQKAQEAVDNQLGTDEEKRGN